ncbi:hypothetical protein UlMin_043862 [Ulmus minor]
MEFELKGRLVAGIENCFASVPWFSPPILIITALLDEVLALELCSRSSDNRWAVVWSDATSTSPATEIAQQSAECIALGEGTIVQVRVLGNVVKASLVTIEPNNEDDWEVLELNLELAEDAILKQVRIVHEAMRFPLWLHGRTIITSCVMSTFPKNAVVQLVSGTEVVIALKRRKKDTNSHENYNARALLRVQYTDRRLIYRTFVNNFELSVVFTSVAFVHPETAKRFSLDSLQLVAIVPRLSSEDGSKDPQNDVEKKTNRKEYRYAIVRLLVLDSVTKGHVMIIQSLHLYLRASLHSWVYLKGCNVLKKDISFLLFSPCHFNLRKDKNFEENGLEVLDSHKNLKTKNMLLKASSGTYMDVVDWSTHDEVIAALSHEPHCKEDAKVAYQSDNIKGLKNLVKAWFFAHFGSISSNTGEAIDSLILGNKTLIHIGVKGLKFGNREEVHASSNGSLENIHNATELPIEILNFDEINKGNNYLVGGSLFEKLQLGDPTSFHAIRERIFDEDTSFDISSLSWMERSASDVINRMMVLLSPASGLWFGTNNLPLPGHILIYGPPGSGRMLLASAVAKFVQEHEDLLAHIVFVSCSKLALEKAQNIHQALSGYISEAIDYVPSLVILDDIDSVIASSSDMAGSQPSSSVRLSCANASSGCLRTCSHVKHEIQKRCVQCSDDILQDVASKCDGYVAYDLGMHNFVTLHKFVILDCEGRR